MPSIDKAGRAIAGLIGYNPGPGLYSRMTRAVEQMPAVIRTQELPGLLRKYPEGVPGWEVKAVAPALEGVESIPRQDLLDLIKQNSPVYTHRELILGGRPQQGFEPEHYIGDQPSKEGWPISDYQDAPSRLGGAVSHGEPHYGSYGQGGTSYAELLLLQPGQSGIGFGSHWSGRGLPSQDQAVAHARYDTHGDALRINELQSDLGIHNRKQREQAQESRRRLEERGVPVGSLGMDTTLPFPLEDAWADILIKRLALEAARGGHRAIEVASPRAIADKVGGNIDNYEHFYGKVVPGAIERLGRKMGGVTPVSQPAPTGGYDDAAEEIRRRYDEPTGRALELLVGVRRDFRGGVPAFAHTPGDRFDMLAHSYREDPAYVPHMANELHQAMIKDMVARGADAKTARQRSVALMPQLMRLAEDQAVNAMSFRNVSNLGRAQLEAGIPKDSATRRYLMSDEMRRRILQQGIGMSVLGGLAAEEEE